MSRRIIKSGSTRLNLECLEERWVPAGDAVLRWNDITLEAVKIDHALGGSASQFGPTRAARAIAIVHGAIYDSANSITHAYQPYRFNVAAPAGASVEAAVAQAARDALASLYPTMTATFDAALAQDLAEIPATVAQQGVAVGHSVATQMLAWRATDGSQNDTPYTPINQPGHWQPDPLHPAQQALTPGWGAVTPFAMASGTQFRPPAPPALNSPEYTAAYNELLAYGGDGVGTPTIRTADQTEIGIYWGYDGQPGLCSPPRLYNQIAHLIAVQQGNTEMQNARYFALVNFAMADAGCAAWEAKYFYDLWRPVTAIRAGDADGNPDTPGIPNWSPYGAPAEFGNGTNFTPPFPAYTSGHATFGGAVFRMIANFYGTDRIPFTFVSDEFNGLTFDMNGQVRPVRPRHFDSLSQAAEENGQSRIYLGIHWAFDKTAGIAQGNAIADYTFQRMLRAKPGAARIVVGADAGGGPHVRVQDAATSQYVFDFLAYDGAFRGGVRVATGDVNGDGVPDIVTAPGPGGGPHIKVFDGADLHMLYSFMAYDSAFRGGVFVSAGDVNNDGRADIVTGPDNSGGPHVRIFSGLDGSVLREFSAYDPAFRGGVRVAVGDIDGDGNADVTTGAGIGGGPHVKVFSGFNNAVVRSFLAYDPAFRGGIFVAVGDCDGDGKVDIVTGAGQGGGPHVQVFNGAGLLMQSFLAFLPPTRISNGIRVGCADIDGDGRSEILAAGTAGNAPVVDIFDARTGRTFSRNYEYDPIFLGGIFVGGWN